LCDRLAIISKGSIEYVGTVDALKKKYRHDARYIIRIRNADNDLIGRIEAIPSLQKISAHASGSSYEYVEFETLPETNNGDLSQIIGSIVKMGGNITSLSEKEPTLEEVFSKVVLK
jgi:ABC-2 type transport system ATP-binding protein